MKRFIASLQLGWMLGIRQLRHANRWVTLLIIVIMMLTFLSNVVVSGILIGLVEGGNRANRDQFTSDLFLSELPDESLIKNSQSIIETIERLPSVERFTPRYLSNATIEANYRTRRNFNDLPNSVGTKIVGINPDTEDAVTDLSSLLVEGEFLDERESGFIIVGSTLIDRYSAFSDLFEPLRDIYPGTKLRITVSSEAGTATLGAGRRIGEGGADDVNQRTVEFTVKGIVDSKVDEVSTRIFMTESDFRRLTGRQSLFANEIAITLKPGFSAEEVKQIVLANDIGRFAKVETAREAIPKFLDDIQTTFSTLGFLIGLIVSGVGAITIFIVIYINAVVRRKQIGILKGIGVRRTAIVVSYVSQAIIYAFIGITLALLLVYFVIVPGVEQNPIDFPFADGIVSADASLVSSRLMIVLIISLISGLLPAWLIVRKNTLDSILGR